MGVLRVARIAHRAFALGWGERVVSVALARGGRAVHVQICLSPPRATCSRPPENHQVGGDAAERHDGHRLPQVARLVPRGLQFQTEHHLVPRMPRHKLPSLPREGEAVPEGTRRTTSPRSGKPTRRCGARSRRPRRRRSSAPRSCTPSTSRGERSRSERRLFRAILSSARRPATENNHRLSYL